jgi:hypothetical protein
MKTPLITLFTMPKPFSDPPDHTSIIQRNAIASWAKLEDVQVMLVGAEPGIASMASELGVGHLAKAQYNHHGTPLVNSAFNAVRDQSETPLMAYCNSDVILLPDFVDAVKRTYDFQAGADFVAFGRRTDVQVETWLDFNLPETASDLKQLAKQSGRVATQVCKEYFVFNRSLYQNMPEFAIGRGNWDNWMIWSAKQLGVPVVNLSEWATAIHQQHDYQHTGTNRRSVYMSGDEAKQNQSLAGGCHWISGSVGTHRLTDRGLEKEKPLLLNRYFWADVPRFLRLASSMVAGR